MLRIVTHGEARITEELCDEFVIDTLAGKSYRYTGDTAYIVHINSNDFEVVLHTDDDVISNIIFPLHAIEKYATLGAIEEGPERLIRKVQ